MPFTRSQAERVMLDRPARFLMVNRNGVVNERLNMLLLQVGLQGFTLLAGNYIEVIYVRFSLFGSGKLLNGRVLFFGVFCFCVLVLLFGFFCFFFLLFGLFGCVVFVLVVVLFLLWVV